MIVQNTSFFLVQKLHFFLIFIIFSGFYNHFDKLKVIPKKKYLIVLKKDCKVEIGSNLVLLESKSVKMLTTSTWADI